MFQKYRIYLRKAAQQAKIRDALSVDTSYLRMASLDRCGEFPSLSGSVRLSSTFASTGMYSRLNSPAGFREIGSSGLIQPGQLQNTGITTSALGNIQSPSILSANSSLFQSSPAPIDLGQSQPSNCATGIRQFSSIDNSSGFAVGSGFLDSKSTGANNIFPCISGNQLLLPGSSQQSQNVAGFRNQSSFGATPFNSETSDICGSNLLDYTRCSDTWHSAVHLSKFPSNSLPLNDTFISDQLPSNGLNVSSSNTCISNNPVDFSSAVPLDDLRGEIQCQEGLIENVVQSSRYPLRQDYNQNMSCNFNGLNSLVSSDGITSNMGQSLNQYNGTIPSFCQLNEDERFTSDLRLKSPDSFQDGFFRNIGYLDDIMGSMGKRV